MPAPKDLPQPTFLSSPKVANICGVTRNTVCCWIRDGKLPSYRTAGGKNLIRPVDLVDFMVSNHMFIPDALRKMADDDRALTANEPVKERVTSAEPAILIVDDDASARGFATKCLESLGLPILQAETGYEALHMLTQRAEVALIILDMVMPGQHGSKTFAEIRKDFPHMPVIVCTGYPIEDVIKKFDDGPRPELIVQKPYRPAHLQDAARAFLSDVGI